MLKIMILVLTMVSTIATILLIEKYKLQKRYDASLNRISELNQKLIDMSGNLTTDYNHQPIIRTYGEPKKIKVQKMFNQLEIENNMGEIPISDLMFEEFKLELQKGIKIKMDESICGNVTYSIDTMIYDLNKTY